MSSGILWWLEYDRLRRGNIIVERPRMKIKKERDVYTTEWVGE